MNEPAYCVKHGLFETEECPGCLAAKAFKEKGVAYITHQRLAYFLHHAVLFGIDRKEFRRDEVDAWVKRAVEKIADHEGYV